MLKGFAGRLGKPLQQKNDHQMNPFAEQPPSTIIPSTTTTQSHSPLLTHSSGHADSGPPPPPPPIPASGEDDEDDDYFHDNPSSHASDLMTASYSEISFQGLSLAGGGGGNPGAAAARPASLAYGEATTANFEPPSRSMVNKTALLRDGPMTSFVADDLIDQIKLASPVQRCSADGLLPDDAATPHVPRHFLQQSQAAAQHQIDVTVISDIECEAQYLAASVDSLTENLDNLLHSISALTADNVEVYRASVTQLTDAMDANIKSMYTIMAKAEEITNLMRPAEQLAARIREIKRLVDMLDSV